MVQMERETRCFFCLDLNWAERKGVGVSGRSGVRKLNHSQLNSSVLYMSVCVCEPENAYSMSICKLIWKLTWSCNATKPDCSVVWLVQLFSKPMSFFVLKRFVWVFNFKETWCLLHIHDVYTYHNGHCSIWDIFLMYHYLSIIGQVSTDIGYLIVHANFLSFFHYYFCCHLMLT